MRTHLKRIVQIAAVVQTLVTVTPHALADDGASAKLGAFHDSLMQRYPGVSHVTPKDLEHMSRQSLVFFDVRETDEYAISRIEGAIRVPPSIRASAFLEQHADKIDGKTVVLYCSVGERSSRLAERLRSQAVAAKEIHNLEGGIFRWHNEFRQVADSDGVTPFIHPFSRRWGRLLERRDQIRMRSEK